MATSVELLVNEFVARLSDAIESSVGERFRRVVSGALGDGAVSVRRASRRGRGRPPGRSARRRSGPVSPARRLQGQYLGRLRALKGANRARVKAIAKEKGVAAAVKEANKILTR
jgi:hypothetical protein